MKIAKLISAALALVACHALLVAPASARSKNPDVARTPHNLSSTVQLEDEGHHLIKSQIEDRICIFCHAPHHATSITPLWSREPSNIVYTLYASDTLVATLQQPRGSSRLCLSCHDGTVALGLLGAGHNLDTSLPRMPSDQDPQKNSNLGTDLSDDHPISFAYPTDPELHDAATLLAQGIKLEQDLYVECTTCHDPHDNRFGNFLVVDTKDQHDALCTKCHNKAGWMNSAHQTGGDKHPGVALQILADGCTSCHYAHSAPGRVSLVKSAVEENNCFLACHRESPSYTVNVYDQFLKPYGHPVQNYIGTHTQNETLPIKLDKKHVECVDCHNPHQTGAGSAPMSPPILFAAPPNAAPAVSAPLRGSRGVDEKAITTVNSAFYEFQICFKCHAGPDADHFVDARFNSSSQLRPDRVIETFNESLRFDAGNPSFHPVVLDRPNRPGISGRSLLSGFKETLVRIYCTDCHTPHGSDEPHVLDARNVDTFPSLTTDYPLCYRCHDSGFLMNSSNTASLHRKHVQGPHDNGDSRGVPCSACHDPHGVPASRGATTQNADHLINFDARYVGRDSVYNSTAQSCTITPGPTGACHATNPKTY